MNTLNRILTLLVVISMPLSASAQFVPIQQAKDQVATSERTELDTVLSDISSKGDISRRNVQTILSDAAAKKIGASAAGRKIETLIGKLKTDLNAIINAYAKKNPPANQLRAAYNSAQDTLNSIRRQSGEVLDQVGFDKAADPKALSGKYLDYQTELNSITEKGLQDADDRLTDRGTKETVKKDLERIAADTQKKIDIDTTTFLTSNPDVLPSAIDRVRKGVVEAFGKAMANRFKTAKERGSDKTLDLSEEELAKVEAAKKEMQELADRATQTVDALMQQISSSNIPTASNVPGQNPLLEAKQRATKQMHQIRDATKERIMRVNSRFQADKDNSTLAKEVVAKEAEKIRISTNETLNGFNKYFTAGDPKKKAYNKAKNDAIDEARGCTDFLCTVGRLASDVGAGVLAATTGVQIAPKTFTSIMGIKDGTGYASSQYSGSNYAGSYAGGQTVPFNPGCYGSLPTTDSKAPRFSFVEKAQAAEYYDQATNTFRDTQFESSADAQARAARERSNAQLEAIAAGTADSTGVKTGADSSTVQKSIKSGANSTTTTTQSSGVNWRSVFQNISPWLNSTIQGGGNPGATNGYFGSCYGNSSGYGGLPGYGSVYGGMGSTTLGSIAAQQLFGTSNVGFNSGYVNQGNAGQRLAAALVMLASSDPNNAAKYQRAVTILQSGPVTFDKIPQLREALAGTNLNSTFGSYGSGNPISGLIYSVCAQAVNGDPALVGLCQQMLTPAQTPGINPNASTVFDKPAALAGTSNPDIALVRSYLVQVSTLNNSSLSIKCDLYSKDIEAIKIKAIDLQKKYLSLTATAESKSVLDGLDTVISGAQQFANTCSVAKAVPESSLIPAKNPVDLTIERIRANTTFLRAQVPCTADNESFGKRLVAEIDGLAKDLSTGTDAQISNGQTALRDLRNAASAFELSCSKKTGAPASTTGGTQPNWLSGLLGGGSNSGVTCGTVQCTNLILSRTNDLQSIIRVRILNQGNNYGVTPSTLYYETSLLPAGQSGSQALLPGTYRITFFAGANTGALTQGIRYVVAVTEGTCKLTVASGTGPTFTGSCNADPNHVTVNE